MPKTTAKNTASKNTAASTASKSKTTSKKTASPAPSQAAPVEQVTPVVVSTSEPSVATTETVELVGFEQAFKEVTASLTAQMSSLKSTLADVKKLEKQVNRQLKEARKGRRKNRRSQEGGEKAKRPPSGFAKPSELSEELCGFLGVEPGTLMARTEVTKHITKYIRDHQLQDPSYKRRILCDKPLSTLLKVGNSDEVTYFNLQSFMKPHFPKTAAPAASN